MRKELIANHLPSGSSAALTERLQGLIKFTTCPFVFMRVQKISAGRVGGSLFFSGAIATPFRMNLPLIPFLPRLVHVDQIGQRMVDWVYDHGSSREQNFLRSGNIVRHFLRGVEKEIFAAPTIWLGTINLFGTGKEPQ